MDVDRFLRELADRFDDFPRSELPRDVRFAEILDAVPGLARSNNLALLNAAASCLDPDESSVEVGTYHGTSLIAAMLDNEAEFVAIDNWSLGDGSRERLDHNLARFGFAGRAEIIEGDAFETLRSGALEGCTIASSYGESPIRPSARAALRSRSLSSMRGTLSRRYAGARPASNIAAEHHAGVVQRQNISFPS